MENTYPTFLDLKKLVVELNKVVLQVNPEELTSNDLDLIQSLGVQIQEKTAIVTYLVGETARKSVNVVANPEVNVVQEQKVKSEEKSVELETKKQEIQEESSPKPDSADLEKAVAQESKSDLSNETLISNLMNTSAQDEALADKFMNKGLSDLNSGIGISEKFMFIHELFNGNTEEYIKTLNHLNNAKGTDEAIKSLHKFSSKLDWDVEAKAYQELKKLVERKYPA